MSVVLCVSSVALPCLDGGDCRVSTRLYASSTDAPTLISPHSTSSRNELFSISGIRGNYPQFFLAYPDGSTTFLGNWEKIEAINDNSDLPDSVLEQHPEIETWNKVFGNVVSTFT